MLQLRTVCREIGVETTIGTRKWSRFGATKYDVALVKMAALLLGCFAVAWTPTIVFLHICILCPQCNINDYIRY